MAKDSNNTPYEWNMTVYRGDSWPRYQLEITDAAGLPRDLTEATVLMQVKKSKSDGAAVKTLTKGGGLVLSGAGNNVLTFSTKVDIAVGTYVYDIEITYSATDTKTYFRGTINVEQDISRT